MLDKTKRYLDDEKERKRIAENAYCRYRSELSALMDRFYSLLGDTL
jgi:spore maturation protein CgeB